MVDKSPGLMGWTAKMMGLYLLAEKEKGNDKITDELVARAKSEYRKLKQEAADIGAEAHEWVHSWILGKKPTMPENEKVVNAITAFLKFQKEHKAKWIETERVIYSKKWNFAGRLDAVAIIDGKLALPDFKSSSGIYPEMRFQVAGYAIAYEEETKKKIERPMIIRWGKEDGRFEVMELDNFGRDKEAFLGCVSVAKRLDELKNGNNS